MQKFATIGSIAILCIFAGSVAVPAQEIQVRGQVVDDETGNPITQMMIQAGRIDPDDPEKTTWGYTEQRTSSTTGRFRTTIRWSAGWTARIVVDGYQPQPILSKPPAEDAAELDVVLRMVRGKPIRGRIIDHEGNPVAGAKVFAVGPRGLNLYGGDARDQHSNEIDTHANSVRTDEQGRFEIGSGGMPSVAICTESLDAWTAVSEGDGKELEIRLPAPTKLTISVQIEGADEETQIFYQLLTHLMEGFDNVESIRTMTMKNGDSLELTSLPPGKYQFCRSRMHSYDGIGQGAMIDRTFVELKAGESHKLEFVRPKGNRIAGVVQWPEDEELAGVILRVQSVEPVDDPWSKSSYTTTFDSQLIAGKPQVKVIPTDRAAFKTEALVPGEYEIQVDAYAPMTPEAMRLSGLPRPKYTASKKVTVTDKAAPNMLIIDLATDAQ